jgi:2,5-diamino-6-(ribosylamino)-4(3H)-pyrimidinone 5'-phosphate reductase
LLEPLQPFKKRSKKTINRNVARAYSIGRIVEDLNTQDGHGRIIIVEGLRDREALLKLGVRTKIMTLRSFLRLASTDWLERKGLTEIIILTDFDKKGKFYSRVIKRICAGRARVNTEYKRRLSESVGNRVKDVEGVFSFIKSNEDLWIFSSA